METLARLFARTTLITFGILLFTLHNASAQCTFNNNSFEDGTLNGWTKYFRTQNVGDWYNYTGTLSPLSSHTIAAPPDGTRAAVIDHTGPTTHELYQDVTIPAGQSTLSYYMAYNNTNGYFVTPNTLDWTSNQQFRVDIIKTTAAHESIAASDMLATLFQTQPGDALIIPATQYFYDTSALAGQTVRVRFAAAIGLSYFPVAIDKVCLAGGLSTFSRSTPVSNGLTVDFGDLTITYPNVTVAGNTSVQQLGTGTQTNPPAGETFVGPAYDISTTATVGTPITVCIHEPSVADVSHLRLLHKQAGVWVDLPTSRVGASTKFVCGQVTSLSPFAVANNPLAPTNAQSSISGRITSTDGAALAGTTVNLSGAANRKTITDSNGNYRFDGVNTAEFYTLTPSRLDYSFSPADRSFSLLTSISDAAFTAQANGRDGVVIDGADYFVRQHYLDFLGREPDESGFNFWSNQILECGSNPACIERRRINVSAAYFLSIEFQQTGGFVDALYRATLNRRPSFAEFMPDASTIAHNVIVNEPNWPQQLNANKQAFVEAWMQRDAFIRDYAELGNEAFVDKLIANAGGFDGDRESLVNGLNGGSLTRAGALRQIVENPGFVNTKANQMFVMMEYFGYLRRDPDEAGYQFWLDKLNQFGGNFEQAEMVKAFIVSGEYRHRFTQ